MSLAAAGHDRKRVKVYELRSNDWHDRGTGFCTGETINVSSDPSNGRMASRAKPSLVQHDHDPDRVLLETKISKDDGYQKQQDTLIVWTEANVTDMALSFQEPEGCAAIWDFVSEAQQRLGGPAGLIDDGNLSDEPDPVHAFHLPEPELGTLTEIENGMRMANSTAAGRDALAKFAVQKDYVTKLVPLVEMAEDLESLADLHRLCNIMKTLILLNDTAIIEYAVTDDVVLGVVGALEYDPDFPSHKANHRRYLADESRFKEVVRIEEPLIKKKIHYTYRLQYLKDVVLARILDDPTFSVLNSLIFFHQVDIVQHVQGNVTFLKQLFGIFGPQEQDPQRKKDAVIFITQCCQIAKGLQANARQQLYQNFISTGLFSVITFALKHPDPSVRVAGTDILMSLIDHDALMMRGQIFKALNDQTKPLTDTLIELLLIEGDLGVKAQMADAIKILLDPMQNIGSVEAIGRSNSEFLAKVRSSAPQPESFVQEFYNASAKKLFQPLKDLENRVSVQDLTSTEIALYAHLVEVLCFFVRQHAFRSKFFLLQENLGARVAQLLACPQKHLKLGALKYFRTCIGLHDNFHNRQIINNNLFEPILNIVFETMPRDNLLNSACLELFEFIKRENMKDLTVHLVEKYRDRLEQITYVDTFRQVIDKYEKYMQPPPENVSFTSVETQPNAVPALMRPTMNGRQQWQGLKETDAEEEAYFNTSDGEDDDHFGPAKPVTNGASPIKPLVDYPEDDDDDDTMDILAQDTSPDQPRETIESPTPVKDQPLPPAERLSEKRRREEDEEDELTKLTTQPKRRSSSISSTNGAVSTHSQTLRRKKSISSGKDGPPKKISIALAVKSGNASADGE
ncbi:DUF625-domain-containing protein [Tothia fuscella]|uniref:DUF625-domain-containing protein n=1 Tax=Tothia fuscella TaxID=1048955 RepID=A0A9P4U322_9PEZI|nr:DUF625-domain-containing protein [Tothia fuscella]